MLYPSLRFGPSRLADVYLLNISFSRSIDFSKALELPGVVDVITAKDIPDTNGTKDSEVLAVDKVWNTPFQMTCVDNHQGTTSSWLLMAS